MQIQVEQVIADSYLNEEDFEYINYYLLVDSTIFGGTENFKNKSKLFELENVNLYEDYSEILKENGAILFKLRLIDLLEYSVEIEKIKSIGAFNLMKSSMEMTVIVDHLEDLMEIIQPNGKSALFRLQDSFALHVAITSMNLNNLRKLLSFSLNSWYWQSYENKYYKIDNYKDNKTISSNLRFDSNEFDEINRKMQPLRLMPILKQYDENLENLFFYDLYSLAKDKLFKGLDLGFKSFEDLILYSILAFQFGENYINESPFSSAYNDFKSNNITFQQATDSIDLDELDEWYENREKV